MAQTHDDWLAGLGVNVAQLRNDVGGGTSDSGDDDGRDAEGRIRQHPGMIDRALGLNPDRSFTEAAMEPFFGRPGDPGLLQVHEGDSDAIKLARAAGIVVTLPIWGVGAVGGAALDHANHIADDFAEIGEKINDASPSQLTNALAPSSGDGDTTAPQESGSAAGDAGGSASALGDAAEGYAGTASAPEAQEAEYGGASAGDASAASGGGDNAVAPVSSASENREPLVESEE